MRRKFYCGHCEWHHFKVSANFALVTSLNVKRISRYTVSVSKKQWNKNSEIIRIVLLVSSLIEYECFLHVTVTWHGLQAIIIGRWLRASAVLRKSGAWTSSVSSFGSRSLNHNFIGYSVSHMDRWSPFKLSSLRNNQAIFRKSRLCLPTQSETCSPLISTGENI